MIERTSEAARAIVPATKLVARLLTDQTAEVVAVRWEYSIRVVVKRAKLY